MSRRKITAGSTSISVPVFIQDTSSTTGAGLGSLVYNTASLAAKYRREGQSSWTTITLVTATVGTWVSSGFVTDGGPVTGGYELGIPDAVLAAGVKWAEVVVYGAANMLPVLLEFELDTINYQASSGIIPADVRQLLGTAWLAPATPGTPDVNAKLIGGTAQTGLDLAANYTAARATKIDYLDAAISSLNNLSALCNLYGSPLLEIPDSGTTQFAFTLVVRDSEGKLVDLDGSPTIAAANAAGTDRSSNLSAVSHPATGRYTFTYVVTSAAAEESLRITCSSTVSAEARYIEWIGAVVNYDTLTTLAAVKVSTDAIYAKLPANNIADETLVIAAIGTPQQAGSAVTLPAIPANWLTANGIAAGALSGKGDWLLSTSYTAPPTANQNAAATWDLATSGHTTADTFGAAMVAAGIASDPLTNDVPGSYSQGTAGYALGRVGSASIAYTGPVNSTTGNLSITSGDDYLSVDGRAMEFSVPFSGGNPDLTGCTLEANWYLLTKRVGIDETVATTPTLAVTAIAEDEGTPTQKVIVQATAAQTGLLTEPRYRVVIVATDADGHRDTFMRKLCTVSLP